VSAEAVASLGRALPVERAHAFLVAALDRRRLLTARACVEILGHSGGGTVDVLAKVLERERFELAAAAALALGRTGGSAAEEALILALQHVDAGVQIAAARALGEAGSAAAVLPLKDAARGSRQAELVRATRQAIAAIQSRLPGASSGQLSLTVAADGQLSLATAEAGQLSLTAEAAGQLSLPGAEEGPPSVDENEASSV
jgi:HEAT repeat protein